MKYSVNAVRQVKGYRIHLYFLFTLFVALLFLMQLPQAQVPPYPPSPVIDNVTWDFTNLLRLAPGSDLWPATWAGDDNLYTSWGDGGGFGGTNRDGRVSLGFARIEGKPENFVAHNVWGGKNPENQGMFDGKSPGILSVNGVIYAWVVRDDDLGNGNTRLAWSSKLAKTWQLSDWAFSGAIFIPATFLNFGKDYAGARDEFIYIYGGKWLTSNPVYMARVPKDQIMNLAAYEFFKGLDVNAKPTWTLDVTQRVPVFTDAKGTDPNGAVHASVVYNSGINRYILTVPHAAKVANWGVFDAPEPWGPWTTVAYYDNWGNFNRGTALIYSLPTKWISADGKTMWMVFSSTGELDSFNLIKATLTLKARKYNTH